VKFGTAEKGGRMDFVLDNAGFELYCDCVYADWLILLGRGEVVATSRLKLLDVLLSHLRRFRKLRSVLCPRRAAAWTLSSTTPASSFTATASTPTGLFRAVSAPNLAEVIT
jgi:hypothetical protein